MIVATVAALAVYSVPAAANAAPVPTRTIAAPSHRVAAAVPARGIVGLPTPPAGTGKQLNATSEQLAAQHGPARGPAGGSHSTATSGPTAGTQPQTHTLAQVQAQTQAQVQAAATQAPVDVPALDNEFTQVTANPDGTMTDKISSGLLQVNRNGTWVPVNTALSASAGALTPAATKAAMQFSAGGTGSLASLGTPAGPMTLDAFAALPAPTVSGDTATYRNVLPDTDLTLTARPQGFEYSEVLRAAPAAAATLRIPLHLPAGDSLAARTGGGWQVTDASGTVLAKISPVVMWDAAHNPSTTGYDGEHPVATQLITTAAGPELDVTPDLAFLTAPTTRYPVTIDPSVSLPDNLDTDVTTYCTTCNYDTTVDLHVGASQYGTLYRSFLRFDDSAIKGKNVTSASLGLWEHDPYTCSPKPTWTEGAAGMGPGTTWNTQPAMDGQLWNSSSFNGSGNTTPPSCGTGGGQSLNITGLVQAWSHNGKPSPEALAMRAASESDTTQWKIFYSANTNLAPFISVTYNTTPATPASGLASHLTSTFTPQLSGPVSSPDGGTLTAHFYTQTQGCSSGCPDIVNDGTATAASGTTATYTIPTGKVTPGQSYSWWMKTCNSAGSCSANSATQTLTVDPLLGAGDKGFFSYTTRKLTDRLTLKVNNASGDLVAEQNDLKIPGLVSDLSLGRTYNSLANAAGSQNIGGHGTGLGWQMSTGSDVKLITGSNPDYVRAWLGDGATLQFIANGAGYLTPAGADGDLKKNSDGSFTLAMHSSAEKFDFDSSGTLTGDTDRNGNKVTFTYTTCNSRPVTATITGTRGDAGGRVVTVSHDASCNLTGMSQTASSTAGGASRSVTIGQTSSQETSATDAGGGHYSYGYDAGHNLTSVTTPDGHQTAIGYDAGHRVTSLTQDPSGINATTTFAYPSATETDVTDADGHTTKYFSDTYDHVTKTTDANGHDQSATFNGDSKISSFASAAGTSTFAYTNGSESLSTSTGAMGATSNLYYNNTSSSTKYLPSSSKDSNGTMGSYTYDGPGNQSGSSDGAASPDTAYSHHNDNGYRPDGSTGTASGNFQQYPGTLDFTTEPNNKGKGNPTPANCTRPSADGGGVDNCTAYQYDAGGDLSAVLPTTGNSLTAQHLAYDGFGRVATATSGRGVTTSYTYDNLDRTTGIVYSDNTSQISYTYNGDGTQATRSDSSGLTSYGYDALNRLTSKTATGATSYTLGYAYDKVGNLTSLTDGRGTTSYAYDPVNNLTKLTEGAGSHNVEVFKYNSDNKRTDTYDAATGYTLDGNNIVTSNPSGFAAHLASGFNSANKLTSLKTSRSSSDSNLVQNLSYSYANSAGKDTNTRQSVTDNLTGKTTTYNYDSTGRLHEAATGNGGPTYDYCYDGNGNITVAATAATDCSANPAHNHDYNSANQLTGTGYDADGNTTASPASSPALASLGYNGASQTTSITPTGAVTADQFGYAGPDQSERVSQSQAGPATPTPVGYVNGLTGVQSQASTPVGATATSTYYERDPGGGLLAQQTASGENYYYFDGIGSVLGLLDTTGKQTATYTYDPYGAHLGVGKGEAADTSAGDANPWRYTGGQYDATTGLYRFGVRYYDPTLGRFTQTDPLKHLLDLRQGNRYGYGGDDPTNTADPSGKDDCATYYGFYGNSNSSFCLSDLQGLFDFLRPITELEDSYGQTCVDTASGLSSISSFLIGSAACPINEY